MKKSIQFVLDKWARYPPGIRRLGILIGLSALAIGIRAVYSPWHATIIDSYFYLKLSESFSQGRFSIACWAQGEIGSKSLYSMLIAFLSAVSEDREMVATLLSVVSGGLLVIPVFYLGKALFDAGTAWIGVALVLLNPFMILFSGQILTESVFTLFFYACLSLGVVLLIRGGPWYGWVLLGALSDLVFLARGTGIYVFPLLMLWLVFYHLFIRKAGVLRSARTAAFLTLGFLMISIPLDMMIKKAGTPQQTPEAVKPGGNNGLRVPLEVRLGSRLASMIYYPDLKDKLKYEVFTAGLTPDGSDYILRVWYKKYSDSHLIDVLREGKFVLWNMIRIGAERYLEVFWLTFSSPFMIFLAIGIIGHLVRGDGPGGRVLTRFFLPSWVAGYGVILLFSASAYFAFSEFELQRYLNPLFPLFFLWVGHGVQIAAQGLTRGLERVGVPPNRFRGKQGMAVILTLLILITFLPQMRNLHPFQWDRDSIPKKVAGEIKKRSLHPPLVMARNPAIPYYAGGSFLVLPFEAYDRVVAFARERGVDYIVITRWDHRPSLGHLLFIQTIRSSTPGLAYEFGSRDQDRPDRMVFAVYRVLKKD